MVTDVHPRGDMLTESPRRPCRSPMILFLSSIPLTLISIDLEWKGTLGALRLWSRWVESVNATADDATLSLTPGKWDKWGWWEACFFLGQDPSTTSHHDKEDEKRW